MVAPYLKGVVMKFYVQSGQMKVVIAGSHINSSEDAACEALLTYVPKGMVIAPLMIVSERGFDFNAHETAEDNVFSTRDMLKLAGMLEDEHEY